jgi:hypothetical protein
MQDFLEARIQQASCVDKLQLLLRWIVMRKQEGGRLHVSLLLHGLLVMASKLIGVSCK